jgi:hypothetical protein
MARNKFVRKDYRHIENREDRIRQAALDVSNDGKCWWVYAYVCSSMNVGVRGERFNIAKSHGNKAVCV